MDEKATNKNTVPNEQTDFGLYSIENMEDEFDLDALLTSIETAKRKKPPTKSRKKKDTALNPLNEDEKQELTDLRKLYYKNRSTIVDYHKGKISADDVVKGLLESLKEISEIEELDDSRPFNNDEINKFLDTI